MPSFRSSLSAVSEAEFPPQVARVKVLTLSEKSLVFVFVTGIFIAATSSSIHASFFPQNAFTKGLNSADVGIIFSVFFLASTLLGGFTGYVITKAGPRFVFIWCLFTVAGATMPFGFVMYCKPGAPFYFTSVICRFVQGIGFVGVELSSLHIVVKQFKNNISKLVGLIEMAIGVGISAGPAIGGIVYDALGYEAPFILISALSMMLVIAAYFYVHPQTHVDNDESDSSNKKKLKTITIWKFLSIPAVYLPLASAFLVSLNLSYFDVAVPPFLTETFHRTVTEAGLIMFGYSIIYGILCPLIGIFSDKKGGHACILTAGFFLVGPAFLFLGPASFLGIQPQLWITAVSLLVIGVGSSFMYVPAVELSFLIARDNGYCNDATMKNIVTITVLGSANLGNLLGPFAGGLLIENFGFASTGTMFSGISLITGFASVIYLICGTIRRRRYDVTDEERQSFLRNRLES